MPLAGHVKNGAGKKIGNPVMPAQVGKHVLPGLVIVDAQMEQSIVEFVSGFHFVPPLHEN